MWLRMLMAMDTSTSCARGVRIQDRRCSQLLSSEGVHSIAVGHGRVPTRFRLSQDVLELGRELCVAVDHQESLSDKEPILSVGEVPRNLCHEASLWMWRGSCNKYRTACDVDDEQRVVGHQTTCSPGRIVTAVVVKKSAAEITSA